MRFILITLCLPIVGSSLISRDALGQTADPPGTVQDTMVVDSAVIAELRREIDWRRIIRVRTNGDWLELAAPKVEVGGLSYESLAPVDSIAHMDLPTPIPYAMVREIRVRKGSFKSGLVPGAIVGTGLAMLLVLRAAGGGDIDVHELPLAVAGGAVLGAVPGLVIGGFLGEALYSWQPVYTAPEPLGQSPAASAELTLRFELRL